MQRYVKIKGVMDSWVDLKQAKLREWLKEIGAERRIGASVVYDTKVIEEALARQAQDEQ